MGIIAYAFNPSIPEVEVGRSLEFCHHSGLLFFDFFFKFYVYKCFTCICICATCVPGVHRGQKKPSECWKLELEMIVKHHGVLVIEPRSSTKVASALNC